MRRLTALLLPGLALAAAAPLGAQQAPDWVTQLLAAARLPIEARDARQEGVRDDELRSVLEAMRRARVPAYDAAAVLDTARAARRQHGPVDNFGAFVQAQLASGKRGRALAAAIRAEHAQKGKGQGQGQAGGQGQGRGRAGEARDSARGRGAGDARPGNARPGNTPGNKPGNAPADRGRGNLGRPE